MSYVSSEATSVETNNGSSLPYGGLHFRRMVEKLPAAAYTCDPEGLITYYNPHAVQLWGRAPKLNDPEDRYCGSFKLFSIEGSPIAHDQCWMALALREEAEFNNREIIVERPDGTRLFALAHANPVHDESGKLIGAVNVLVDVTERKKSESQFRQLLEKLPAGAYTCDSEGLITYYNEHAVGLWGRAPKLFDPVDRYCGSFKLFSPDGVAISHDRCWMALAIKENREHNGREIIIERPDGERITALAHANPIHDDSGRLVGAVNVLVDISERKEAQKALEISEERLRELNQSLEEKVEQRTKALSMYRRRLQLLASRLSAAEHRERRRVATDIHDNLAQLLAICKMKLASAKRSVSALNDNRDIESLAQGLDDSLKYARTLISDLSPPFDISKNDLGNAVRWVINKLEEHGLAVEFEDDGKPKPISQEALTMAFESVRELLFNVLRHSGMDKARVAVRGNGHCVTITVEDDGIGFEPSVDATEAEGGFGLFSVRERIGAIGGSFEIESAAGEGTRATLSIPFTQNGRSSANGNAEKAAPIGNASTAPKSSRRIQVLLVDDHEMMREGLRRIIDAEHDMVVVAEASDGEMAVRQALELEPDVIIMDVGLPKKNGVKATEEIVQSIPQIKVIALSMNETEDTIDAMQRAGATHYLFKSQVFDTLCPAIRKFATMRASDAIESAK